MKKTTKTLLSILCLFGIVSVSFAGYSVEEQAAYNYAFKNKITTMWSIDRADMWWNLTRVAMAKMLSNYAINILWLKPDTSKNCYFSDVSSSLDYQYDNWVTKACQLWLMGVWIDRFYPNWIVTRAEFWTVLSRALNANDTTKLNQMNNATPYYSEHLNYLKEEWIMHDILNPTNFERRWRVMLMLMRADKNSWYEEPIVVIHNEDENKTVNINSNEFIYKNNLYWIQIYFGEAWNGAKIKKEVTWIENFPYNYTMLDISKNGNSIMKISVYSYDEYEKILELSNEDVMCDQKCFKNSIIWHNNKYYFGLWVSNMTHEELKALIPSLKCSNRVVWDYTQIVCDWWVEQIMPNDSFYFFDVSENINKSNKYPNAQKYCLNNNWTIITNDYWDEFCTREDWSYYELRAYEQNWQAGRRWTDEPYCSIYEDIVCWIDWISYVNECRLKDAWVEKDTNAKFVDWKCVKK